MTIKWKTYFTSGVLILMPVVFSCVLIVVKHIASAYCLVIRGTVLTDVAVELAWQKKKKKNGGGNLLNTLVREHCLPGKEMEN